MADETRSHFEIPFDQIHEDAVESVARPPAYSRTNYAEHGTRLLRSTKAAREGLSKTRDYPISDSVFLEVRTPSDRPVTGEKGRLRQSGMEFVTAERDPDRAVVRMTRETFDDLESRIHRYATMSNHPFRSYLAVIEDIGLVPPEAKIESSIDVASKTPIACILHLYSGLSEGERAAVALTVRNFIASLGHGEVVIRTLSIGVTLIEATLTPPEMIQTSEEFTTVRYITPNRLFYITDTIALGKVPPGVVVNPAKTDVVVGVIDSGISPRSPYLAPLIVQSFPQLPPGSVSPEYKHGTFVASRVLYGDDLEAGIRNRALTPACRLIDIPVFGVLGDGSDVPLTEGHLAQAIDQVIPQLPTSVRIVNACVGTDSPIVDNQFSVVANVLDRHARDRDLVVIVSAGNIRDHRLIRNYQAELVKPFWRVDPPAESLLALTVGSIALFGDQTTVASPRGLSPFSRRGPGADGGLKPELVAHGGNCYKSDPLYTSRIAAQGIHGDGLQVACDVGTSYAAPLVSRHAALVAGFYGKPPANLIRALLCHFTSPAHAPTVGIDQTHLVGLGETNSDDCVRPRSHAATFFNIGTIKTEVFRYVPFFVPQALATGRAAGHLRIRVTVALDPPVDPQNPKEYSQSRFTIGLRKPQQIGYRDIGVSEDSIDTAKWSPIVQFEKAFRRNYMAGAWELRLRLWTRGLPRTFAQAHAVVVEVIDDSQTVDVWQDVEAEAGAVFKPFLRVAA